VHQLDAPPLLGVGPVVDPGEELPVPLSEGPVKPLHPSRDGVEDPGELPVPAQAVVEGQGHLGSQGGHDLAEALQESGVGLGEARAALEEF